MFVFLQRSLKKYIFQNYDLAYHRSFGKDELDFILSKIKDCFDVNDYNELIRNSIMEQSFIDLLSKEYPYELNNVND